MYKHKRHCLQSSDLLPLYVSAPEQSYKEHYMQVTRGCMHNVVQTAVCRIICDTGTEEQLPEQHQHV